MIRAILTDIEGTTSSISFVHDVLFPYARERMADFVRAHAEDPRVRKQVELVSEETGQIMNIDTAIEQLIQWIDEDKKITPLKTLQGMIWEAGYRNGDFTGHIYKDAAHYLEKWHEKGIDLYVFSSGSVKAQQLLFSHSDAGDLTPLFSGYYDTHMGSKRDTASYDAIARDIGLDPEQILFLSDTPAELDTARAVGMQTMQLVRDGEPEQEPAHAIAYDFAGVDAGLG